MGLLTDNRRSLCGTFARVWCRRSYRMTVLHRLMFVIISGFFRLENSDHVLKGNPLSHRRPSIRRTFFEIAVHVGPIWWGCCNRLAIRLRSMGRANQIATEMPLNAAFKGRATESSLTRVPDHASILRRRERRTRQRNPSTSKSMSPLPPSRGSARSRETRTNYRCPRPGEIGARLRRFRRRDRGSIARRRRNAWMAKPAS